MIIFITIREMHSIVLGCPRLVLGYGMGDPGGVRVWGWRWVFGDVLGLLLAILGNPHCTTANYKLLAAGCTLVASLASFSFADCVTSKFCLLAVELRLRLTTKSVLLLLPTF